MMAMLAALGAGYLGHKEKERQDARQEARDKRDQEDHDMRMEEYGQKKADRAALDDAVKSTQSEAYTPAQGQELEAIANAKDEQGNHYYKVDTDATGKYTVAPNFQNETGDTPKPYAPATIAAKGVQPLTKEQAGARRSRMAELAASGNVLAANALGTDQKAVTFEQEQTDRARRLQAEGVFDAAAAMRRGDAAGVAEAFNRSGEHKIIGDVTITPEKRTIPGVGDVDTYTASFQLQGPDGEVRQVSRNSHDLSMAILPYEKQLEELRKGTRGAADLDNIAAQTNEHNARANYWKNGGAPGARASSGQGGDKPYKMDEDDKLRVNQAETRVRDAEKMLNEAMRAVVPGDDPEKAPAVMNARGVLKQAKRAQFITGIQTGLVTKEQLVDSIYAGALEKGGKGDQDVMKSLSELSSFDSALAEEVATLVHNDERWKALPKTGTYPKAAAQAPAAPQPAGAPQQPATAVPQKPSPAGIAAQGVAAKKPTYEAWLAAKNARDTVLAAAEKMSPDRRDSYLRSRLPEIEQAIKFNQNYNTY